MNSADCLAYFLDDEDLRDVLPEWPEQIDLALCLDDGGSCELVVYHRDESARILIRVADVLGRDMGGFSVVPEVPGHPTRRVLFSEEQQFLAIVASADRLLETATDYLINYRFAIEEGLDPDLVTNGAARPAAREEPAEPEEAPEMIQAEPAQPVKAEPDSTMKMVLPPDYYFMSDMRRRGQHFVPARLTATADAVTLLIEPELVVEGQPAVAVDEIACRDDFARFALPLAGLGGWQPGRGAIVQIPGDQFPEAMLDGFSGRTRLARVTFAGDAVFVAPCDDAVVPVEVGAIGRVRRAVGSVRLALAGLLAVGAVSGTVVASVQQPESVEMAQVVTPARVQAASSTALRMIDAFAHSQGPAETTGPLQ